MAGFTRNRFSNPFLSSKIGLIIFFAFMMVLQLNASPANANGASVRRLQVRSPQVLQPVPVTPAVIECGLTFMPDYLGPGQAACKNFGGFHYNCTTDSCHAANSETSPKSVGGLVYKNCTRYTGALGLSALETTQTNVVGIHLISYYYVQKLNPPIGTITQWPERLDVVGYNTSVVDYTPASSGNYHCPLAVSTNLIRPWCFNCFHAADGSNF